MNHFGCPTKLWDISRKTTIYLCKFHKGSSEHGYESWMAKVVSTVILIALVCLGSPEDNKGWSPNCLQSLNRKSFSVSYFFVQQSNVISCVPTEWCNTIASQNKVYCRRLVKKIFEWNELILSSRLLDLYSMQWPKIESLTTQENVLEGSMARVCNNCRNVLSLCTGREHSKASNNIVTYYISIKLRKIKKFPDWATD